MKSSRFSLALCLLLTFGAVQAAQAAPRKADARQLLALAERGLAGALQAAGASQGRLDRARAEQRPFWSAMDKMDAALDNVRGAMQGREQRFFRVLERGSEALGELRVVWARTGVADPGVSEGLRILSGSYELLRSGYGREAVRNRQGAGLTEAERQRFFRIQRAQERFAESLRVLQEKARQRGDAAMQAELQRMAEEAWRIAMARMSLEAYLNALMIADAQRGEWTGNSQFAPREDRSEWLEAGAVVEELYTEQEVGQVFIVNMGNVGTAGGGLGASTEAEDYEEPMSMTYLDEPTDVPESFASEVAVFEPAGDVDLLEEEEALAEEEMEEAADTDLEVYEEVLEPEEGEEIVDEAAIESELVEGAETIEAVEIIEVEDLPVATEETAQEPAKDAKPDEKAPATKDPAPDPKKESKKDPKPPGLS